MADLITLFIICCCGGCLVGLGLLVVVAFVFIFAVSQSPSANAQPQASSTTVQPKTSAPKKPPKAPPMPTRPPSPGLAGSAKSSPARIIFPGGADEWPTLRQQVNLQLGDTADSLAEKGAVMIVFIQSLEKAVLTPLWKVAQGAKYYAREAALSEDHPAAAWRDRCQQAQLDWTTYFENLRSSCLGKGGENSQALECIVSGVVQWLEYPRSLHTELETLQAQEAGSQGLPWKKIRPWLEELLQIQRALEKRDISWMHSIPRSTFGNAETLQENFAHHFGPFSRAKAILPMENILERRLGRLELLPTMAVEYAFGVEDGEEYLQFRVLTQITHYSSGGSHKEASATNYRLYPSGKQVKYAPWVCEYCGMRLEDDATLCGECAYDEIVFLAWGKKDPDAPQNDGETGHSK